MLTVVTGKMPDDIKNENPATDPARLDRIADALLHLGFRHQAERLAHEAQARREGQP